MKLPIFFLLIFVLGTFANQNLYGNNCDCIMINNRREPPDDDCNCSCTLPWNNCKWSEYNQLFKCNYTPDVAFWSEDPVATKNKVVLI